MINIKILEKRQYLLFPARKICELFDVYEGKNKDLSKNIDFRTPYDNLRKAGIITEHDTIAHNIQELKQYLYG